MCIDITLCATLCNCLFPCNLLRLQGACGVIGVTDLLTGVRLGRVDLGSEAVSLYFAPEAALLIVAVAVSACSQMILPMTPVGATPCILKALHVPQ